MGKDAAPFINECAAVYQNKGTVVGGTTFDVTIDYYIEVWNMSTKDVKGTDLGPNPFIRVSQPTKWQVDNSKAYGTPTVAAWSTGADVISDDTDGISPSSTRPTSTARDFKIDVSNAVFPAGQVTVITTDAAWASAVKDPTAATHVVLCPWVSGQGKSEYKGHYPVGRPAAGKDVLNMVFDSNPTYGSSSSDYETDITFGSDWGYVDCLQGALPLSWGGRISIPYTGTSLNFPYFFGGAMIGNFYNLSTHTTDFNLGVTGDPRSTNEQLQYWLNPPSASQPGGDQYAAADQSKFTPYAVFNAGTYGGSSNSSTLTPVPGNPNYGFVHTLGQPNYRTVRPNRPDNPWADFPPYYSSPNGTPTTNELALNPALAPNPVANGALTSIGQLADIYDASRTIDLSHLVNTRGGGRSLKIGQHDDLWDGDQVSASRSWTAWRLTDVFSTVDAMQQPGLININGVYRDNGAALRAALNGFKFQPVPPSAGQTSTSPTGDSTLYNASNSSATIPAVDELITELKKRLVPDPSTASTGIWQTGTGPFWERGELSELPGFGRSPDVARSSTTPPLTNPTTYAQAALTNTDMSSLVFDRGREELFRRLVEMTTTRGNVFTVYSLGQAFSDGNITHPVSTQKMKVTFRVVPKNSASDPAGPNFFPSAEYKADYSNFDPATALPNRFKKPDHYEIEVLSVSSSN
ncbi:MAG: hypothetical protein INR62_05055 [Rhodospirillales bacterium]|nr:hypothetical protein [Acetobacter sp.]